MIVMKEGHRSLETGGMPYRVTWGQTRVSQEAEGESRQGPEPLLGFSWEGMGEIGQFPESV